jgi:hypothetical protein
MLAATPLGGSNTTHYSVVDPAARRDSHLTRRISPASAQADGTGVLLNNES